MEGHADEIHAAGAQEARSRRMAPTTRCASSSSARSTSISNGSSTRSRTSPTRSTASSSTTPERARPMHELAFPLLVGLIVVALAFDFLNGLHDAANSIATVVATRLLGPVQAVAVRRLLQLRRLFPDARLPQPAQGRRDDRQGPDRQGSGHARGGVRRADRRDVLERRHLAEGHPLLVAATRWSAGWSARASPMPA